MLHGLIAQPRADGKLQPRCYGIQAVEDHGMRERDTHAQRDSGRFKHDLTGQMLKDSLMMEARKKELDFFNSRWVWVKVSREKAF